MEKYEIEIKEELSRVVDIEAENYEQALKIAEAKYDSGEIALNENDYKGVEINPYDEEINKVMGGR
jgi:hypothetical protein